MTADTIIENLIFKDDIVLQPEEVIEFLKTRQEVSSNERALDYIYDFVAVNGIRFSTDTDDNRGEVWGIHDGEYICIIRNQFNKICIDGGFNPTAVLSWLKANKKIKIPKGKGFTIMKRINKQPTHCIWLKKLSEEVELEEIDDFDEKCPF